jgi:hypothetical protein
MIPQSLTYEYHKGGPTSKGGSGSFRRIKRALAGCSGERPNTRRTFRLAFLCRSSRCLRGEKISLAANAIYGKSRHHSTFCAHADGSSHEVNRGLSWMPPRCGRSRVNGIRVRASCRPSSSLGRNLFLRGGFSSHPIQRRSMEQRVNRRLDLH